jgi:hypothetical protein
MTDKYKFEMLSCCATKYKISGSTQNNHRSYIEKYLFFYCMYNLNKADFDDFTLQELIKNAIIVNKSSYSR